jgi:hypothetical protein
VEEPNYISATKQKGHYISYRSATEPNYISASEQKGFISATDQLQISYRTKLHISYRTKRALWMWLLIMYYQYL